jgi:hypothetical protein
MRKEVCAEDEVDELPPPLPPPPNAANPDPDRKFKPAPITLAPDVFGAGTPSGLAPVNAESAAQATSCLVLATRSSKMPCAT